MSLRKPVLAAMALVAAAGGAVAQDGPWPVYRNDRYGFTIGYPADVFIPSGPSKDDSRYFVSADGKAKLMVSGGANSTAESIASYRAFVIRTAYSAARITYGRADARHFVVSGFKGDQIFYERVEFACDGRLITGWQIVYPAAERAVYDTIVERMSRTWRPVGPGGCP